MKIDGSFDPAAASDTRAKTAGRRRMPAPFFCVLVRKVLIPAFIAKASGICPSEPQDSVACRPGRSYLDPSGH